MEMTPKKILEFTEYAIKNPNATEGDFYANRLGSILHLLCNGNPKRAKNWSYHLIKTLEESRHPRYSLSTFLGFVVNGKNPRISDRANIRLANSKND